MTKNKYPTPQGITVWTGYTLFGLLVVSILLSVVIPMTNILFTPGSRVENTILTLVTLTAGSVLPALLAYFIGDSAIRSKHKGSHHFSGVIFGLLSYWLMMLISIPLSYLSVDALDVPINLRLVLFSAVPILGVILVSGVLATMHARSRHASQDITDYKPFQYTFILTIVLLIAGGLLINVTMQSIEFYSLIPPIVFVILGAISYATLRKVNINQMTKLTWSAISVSVFFIAAYVLTELTTWISYTFVKNMSFESYAVVSGIAFALSLAGWAVYWTLTARAFSKSTK